MMFRDSLFESFESLETLETEQRPDFD